MRSSTFTKYTQWPNKIHSNDWLFKTRSFMWFFSFIVAFGAPSNWRAALLKCQLSIVTCKINSSTIIPESNNSFFRSQYWFNIVEWEFYLIFLLLQIFSWILELSFLIIGRMPICADSFVLFAKKNVY